MTGTVWPAAGVSRRTESAAGRPVVGDGSESGTVMDGAK